MKWNAQTYKNTHTKKKKTRAQIKCGVCTTQQSWQRWKWLLLAFCNWTCFDLV